MSSSPKSLRCLVLSAGGTYVQHKQAAEKWASEAATAEDRPDLVFIQEVPSDAWLERWREQGYRQPRQEARVDGPLSIITFLDEQTCVQLTPAEVPDCPWAVPDDAPPTPAGRPIS